MRTFTTEQGNGRAVPHELIGCALDRRPDGSGSASRSGCGNGFQRVKKEVAVVKRRWQMARKIPKAPPTFKEPEESSIYFVSGKEDFVFLNLLISSSSKEAQKLVL